jgi:hypothetical protein
MRTRAFYEEYFRDALEIDFLKQNNPGERDTLDGILDLIVDTCCANKPWILISGDRKPIEVVKSRFMKLNSSHIEYVLKCLSVMDWSQNAPSLSQAQRLKKLSQDGKLTPDTMREIMNEVKKGDLERVTFRNETLRKYFPRSYTAQQMQDQIIKLLEQWQKRKQRDKER